MTDSFGSFCDDFFADLCVNTQLDLPTERDTILSFFEQVRKRFPRMVNFSRRDNGDFLLEEEKQGERFRWVSLEKDRICGGCEAPEKLEEAYELHTEVLELMPYMLGVTFLDIDSIDTTFTMDFDYQGNHDEIISEALLAGSKFSSLFDIAGVKTISCNPSAVIALSEDCRVQARIALESRTSLFEARGEKVKQDEPISLYFTIRRYPGGSAPFDLVDAYRKQCRIAEQLMFDRIIPHFVQPLVAAIAQRR